jgi:hypothetical protein
MSPSKINWLYKISAKDRNNIQGWEAQIGSKICNNYIDSSATNMTHECRLLDKQMKSECYSGCLVRNTEVQGEAIKWSTVHIPHT